MIRYGLCCAFRDQPIRFRTATATAAGRLAPAERLKRISEFAAANACALFEAIQYCVLRGIGCFRVSSQILPLRTHPIVGYDVEQLPAASALVAAFERCGAAATAGGIRLTFHPDQFVVLNSPRADVVRSSIDELRAQAEVAEWIGADVIMIHGGGAYGESVSAIDRLKRCIDRLPHCVRSRLALENDDRNFAPLALLPVCDEMDVPFVYDVHHHRCLKDGMSIGEATERAISTWDREPLFHLSSPAGGWTADQPRVHDDWIEPSDFPREWLGRSITVEIEARAKEAAVLRLMRGMALVERSSSDERAATRSGPGEGRRRSRA